MYLLKGLLIGMFVALPVGPLGLLSIQRTLRKGWRVGFLSAVGAITSDVFYSSIAILGISFMDDFVNKHRHLINELTGILFLIVGINILISGSEKRKTEEIPKYTKVHPFFTHFLMGLSNPMTFIIFFAIFTKVGIYAEEKNIMQNITLIAAIFLGSCSLWLATSSIIEKSKKSFKFENFILMDKILGAAIMLFGLFSVVKGTLGK